MVDRLSGEDGRMGAMKKDWVMSFLLSVRKEDVTEAVVNA